MRHVLHRTPLAALIGALACFSGSITSARADWEPGGLQISPSDSAQSDPVVAPDGGGGAFFVWQDYGSGQSVLRAQHLTWDGVPASGWPASSQQVGTGPDYDPFVVADGLGGAFVAAGDGTSIGLGLWHLASDLGTAGVPTGTPARLGLAKGSPTVLPFLLPDGAGGVFQVWEHSMYLSPYVSVQHYGPTGNVVSPWPAGGLGLGYAEAPVACSDGAGGLIVVVGGLRAAHARVDPDTVFADWPGGWIDVAPSAGSKDAPGIVSDGVGGAIVVWQDSRNGSYEQVYSQRLTGNGSVAPGWPDSGLAVCTFPTDAGLTRYPPGRRRPQRFSVVIGDGSGGAFIAWRDMRADSGDVYLQHVLPDGSVPAGWPHNGLALCSAPGVQMAPSLAQDGTGGVFVSWQDRRSGNDWHVYAQHVLASGALSWTANGVPVCTGPGDHVIPRLVADGSSGAIVAWQDTRLPSSAVFTSRLAPDGTPVRGPCVVIVPVGTSSVDSGTVHIVWRVDSPDTATATVYRRQVDGPRVPIARRKPDLLGIVDFADVGLIAGCRYAYALGVSACQHAERILGETRIDVPDGAGFSPLHASAPQSQARAGRLILTWRVDGDKGLAATIFRRDSCSTWMRLASAAADDSDRVQFEDHYLFEGSTVCYKLVVHACGRDHDLAEHWISIPYGFGFVPTLAVLEDAEAGPSTARLVWRMVTGPSSVARVYRRDSTSAWASIGEPAIGPNGLIRYVDTAAQAGARYEYRLGLLSCGVERFFGPAVLQIPAPVGPHFDLSLGGGRPNPARHELIVSFTLPSAEHAILELVDVTGRRLSMEEVGALGPGSHVVSIKTARALPTGLYWVRLTQSGRTLTIRGAVVH